MVLYQVYSQEHRIRYLTNPCATAVVFQICCLFLTFLPPLFTGYFTSGFYYKELTYVEQPNVTFLEKYNVIINSFSAIQFASSDARLNNYFISNYAASVLKTNIPQDTNGDSIADQQSITITTILSQAIDASNINIWLLFQYQLNQNPLVNMETLGLVSLQAPLTLETNTTLTLYGKLHFRQREPVLPNQVDSSIQGSIIDFGTDGIVPSLEDVTNNYYSRNYYTTFDKQYVQWSSQPSSDGSRLLTINVAVNTDPQVIRYVPSFWKEFRWSWIQYFTGLLPFFYVANKIKEFVFSNGLVRSFPKKSP